MRTDSPGEPPQHLGPGLRRFACHPANRVALKYAVSIMRRRHILVGLLFTALVVPCVFATLASAQGTPVFTLVLSADELNKPGGSGQTIGQQLGTLSVFADEELCTTVDVSAPTGDPAVYLGLEGQPEACSLQWSVVAFKDSRGEWLNTWFTLQPGKTFRLSTFEIRDCSTANCPPRPIGPPPTRAPSATPSPGTAVTSTAGAAAVATPAPVLANATPLAVAATPVPVDIVSTAPGVPVVRSVITPPSTGSAGLVR